MISCISTEIIDSIRTIATVALSFRVFPVRLISPRVCTSHSQRHCVTRACIQARLQTFAKNRPALQTIGGE